MPTRKRVSPVGTDQAVKTGNPGMIDVCPCASTWEACRACLSPSSPYSQNGKSGGERCRFKKPRQNALFLGPTCTAHFRSLASGDHRPVMATLIFAGLTCPSCARKRRTCMKRCVSWRGSKGHVDLKTTPYTLSSQDCFSATTWVMSQIDAPLGGLKLSASFSTSMWLCNKRHRSCKLISMVSLRSI